MRLLRLFNNNVVKAALSLALLHLAFNTQLYATEFEKNGYAIIATPSVLEDSEWNNVVESLKNKYADEYEVTIIKWNDYAFARLRDAFPKYACFVVRPEEATSELLATIWQKTRELDDDPYGDVIWGIITGYDATDALRLTQVKPTTIETACGATSIATKYFKSSVVFDEGRQNHWRVKEAGKEDEDRTDGPSDTTHAIADALNTSQLFVTSGHASERNWSLGYSYNNGFWVAQDGKLYGVPTKESGEKPFLIEATGSRIHLASGNCLWGHIDEPCCMALMMIRHAKVDMLMGYVVPSWFGYMGWGVQDYYIEQPGRFTVAEAFYANNQALMYLLVKDAESRSTDIEKQKEPSEILASLGSIISESQDSGALNIPGRLSNMRREGLMYDRDVVALYGDPAWNNALAVQDSGWRQNLSIETTSDNKIVCALTITPLKGKESYNLVDGNGSERSHRPIFQILPTRVTDVEIIEGQNLNPTITDNFILIPSSDALPSDKAFSVKFSAKQL